RDTDRAFFAQGFDQDRKPQPLRPYHPMSLRKHSKSRHCDAMVRKDLFREGLVARERQASSIASRIRLSQKFEVAHHMLVEQGIAIKIFKQIEGNVRLKFLTCLLNDSKIARHADDVD